MADEKLSLRLPPVDRRRLRAQAIVGSMMQAIRPHLGDDAYPYRIADALLALFHEADAEIITKEDRRAAGLPDRNEYGLTPDEHRAIEAQHQLLMVAPPKPIVFCMQCPHLPHATATDVAVAGDTE